MDLGQWEGMSHRVMGQFVPVSCDSLTPRRAGLGAFSKLARYVSTSFPSVPESVLKPGSQGSPQLPQAGCGRVQSSQQEACSLRVGALRVSRSVKRCLCLLLRLASSGGAWGNVRVRDEEDAEAPEFRRRCSQLSTPGDPRLILHGVREALEAAWALTGQSGSLHETCFRTSPAAAAGSRGGGESVRSE